MEWPALSPDLNPIEHVCDRLKRSVCGRSVPPQTFQDLEQTLIEEWNLIQQHDPRRLIWSIPRRCQAVINAHGGHAPYQSSPTEIKLHPGGLLSLCIRPYLDISVFVLKMDANPSLLFCMLQR